MLILGVVVQNLWCRRGKITITEKISLFFHNGNNSANPDVIQRCYLQSKGRQAGRSLSDRVI